MNDKYHFQIMKIIYFIICFQLIENVNSKIYFTYPYAITLSNKNIFIVHQLGVDVIDPSFTQILKKVIVFSEDEKISTENELSKVEIKYKNQYIIALIKDKIYIFNNEGDFLCVSNAKITSDTSIEYYTLVPIEIKSQIYYFIVGFFNRNNYLNLLLYKYILNDNLIELNDSRLENKFMDSFSFKNKGLSCEYMYYSTKDILTCFFSVLENRRQALIASFYIIKNNLIIAYSGIGVSYAYSYDVNNVKFIKSTINRNKNLGLICFYDEGDKETYCSYFDISYPKFYYDNNYDYFGFIKACRNKIYGLKLNYVTETNKIVFSCIDYDGSIQVDFFDNNLESSYTSTKKQFITCDKIYGHSILYLSNSNKYYVLSDVLCGQTKYLLQELDKKALKDMSNITIIEEEEKEEEEEEEKEKEKEEEEKEKEEEKCNEKCKYCDKNCIDDLCIECNNDNDYYPIKSFSSNNKYQKCVNNDTKPSNYYFNKKELYYEKCHGNCETCENGGNSHINNCTLCKKELIFLPDIQPTTNCVKKCKIYYYYDKYGLYSCTQEDKCPDDFPLLVKDKSKCTNDCKKEGIYNYNYNGECLKECPDNTEDDNNDQICKDIDLNKCFLKKEKLYYKDNYTNSEIEYLVKEYVKYYKDVNNHVTLYQNKIYNITIYKNGECISYLNLTTPEIDFGECYQKVKSHHQIEVDLIIVIITKLEKGKMKGKKPKATSQSLSYSMFNPKDGKELDSETICVNDVIQKTENLENKLEENNVNKTKVKMLTEKGINVFNKSDLFFTDICYHFDLPVKKDVPLKDRLAEYNPEIELCEGDCIAIGVNLTDLKAICECKFNSKNKNNILEDNIVYQTSIGEIKEILSHTNIEVIRCYKDILEYKYFISNVGGFMILFFIAIQIIFTIIFIRKGTYSLKKYIFDIANKYIAHLQNDNTIQNNALSPLTNNNYIKNAPQKKKYSMKQINAYDIFNKTQNMKRKLQKRKCKSSRKVNFSHKLSNNSVKLGSNDINNPNSNNILIGNSPSIYIDKININNVKNKNIILDKNLFLHNEIVQKNNNLGSKGNQSDLIINLKNNLLLDIEEYLNTDPDDMDYEDAIKKDKRKFGDYFMDKLKTNQIMLNTFYTNEPLRPRSIKILLLVLNIDLYFVINGLFFNEEYISEVYHSGEHESFSAYLFRFSENCFYTTFVGVFVNYIIDCFFVEEKKLKGILKREKNNLFFLKYEITQLIKSIISRYKYFILVSFVITSFTWYYVSCFNNIYPYTKGEWIKTSVLIIIVMQILSILVSLLEAIIRYFSFRYKSEKLYRIIHWLS